MKQEDALIKDPSTQEKTDLEKKDRAADKVGSNDVAASTDMNSKKNAEQEQTQNDKNMEQMKKHELEKEFNSSKKTVYQSPKEQKMNNFVLQVCGNVKHPEIRPTGIAHDQSLRSIQEEDEESKAWQRMVLDGRDYFPRHERSTEDDPLVNDDEFSFDSEENSFEDDDDSRGSLSEDDENDGIEEVQNANNEQQISHEYGSQAYMNRDIESSSESRESNNRKTPFIETNNNNDWFSYEGTSSSILKLPNVIAPSILPVFRSQIPKLNKEEKASFLSKNSKSNNSLDSEDATLELSLKPPTIIPDNKSLNLGFLQITKQQALPKKESYLSPDTATGTCSNNNVNISSSTHHSTSLPSTSFISTGPIKSLKRKRRRQPTRMELFFLSVGLYLFISVTLAPLSNNDNLLMSGVRGSVRQKSDSSGKDELLWENKDESNRMQTEDVSQYQNDHMVITQANEQHQIAYPQMQQNSEQSLIHEGMTITQAHTEEIQQQSLQRQRFQPLLDQPQQQQQQQQHQPQVQMQMQHPHLWQDANLNAADDDMIPSLNQHEKHMQMHAALVEPQKQEQLQIHAQPQSQPLAQRPQIHKNVEEQMNPQAHAQMQTPVSPQEQSHIPQPQIFHPHQNGEQHEHQQFDFNPQQLPELEIVQNNESRVHEESEQEVQQQEQVQQQQGVEPHVSNNLPVQSVQDFLEDKKIKKEEEILKKQESQEAAGPLFSAQKTSSLLDELRAIDAEHDAKEGDMPIFWLIPPDSPTTQSVKDILDNCFGLTRADVYGPSGAHSVQFSANNSNEEDIIVTSNLFELVHLLNPLNPLHQRGLMFTFITHPVDRAAALYEELKLSAEGQTLNADLISMTLLDYANHRLGNGASAKGPLSLKENNFVVRSLAQVPMDVPLHGGHVAHAEQVLKKFALIGSLHDEETALTSWKRIQKLYGWRGDESCIKSLLPKSSETKIAEDSEEYKLLAELNEYDMVFYDGVQKNFDDQGRLKIFQNL